MFLLLIPSLALPGTLASLFYLFYGKSGALNQFLIIPLGIEPINWMMDPGWILLSNLSGSLEMDWVNHFVALLWYEGAIPRSWQFEAARLEGATSWNRLSTIVYPGVKHLLFFGGIFLFVDGVAAFSGAYNLLGGSGGVLDAGLLFVTYAYQVAFPAAPVVLTCLWLRPCAYWWRFPLFLLVGFVSISINKNIRRNGEAIDHKNLLGCYAIALCLSLLVDDIIFLQDKPGDLQPSSIVASIF